MVVYMLYVFFNRQKTAYEMRISDWSSDVGSSDLIVTAAATIVLDLIVAVEIGIAVAAGLALRSVARTASATPEPVPELDRATSDELLDSGILSYRLDGALLIGAAHRLLTELTAVTHAPVVTLRLHHLTVPGAPSAEAPVSREPSAGEGRV